MNPHRTAAGPLRGLGRLGTLALLVVALLPLPVDAAARPGTVIGAATTLPSFSESEGCGTSQGTRGPYASQAGALPDSEPVLGPWGSVFGRTIGDVRGRLVQVTLPMMDWPRQIWIHEAALPAFEAVVANLEREIAAGRWYTIRSGYTGGFRPETVPPGRHLSFHAVGAAIDINSHTNPYRGDNVLETDMPAWFVEAWTDAGWCWGGDWQSIKDPMHFSWQGPLASPQAGAPAPPISSPASFTRRSVFDSALAPSDAPFTPLIGDVDRDGAPDAVRLWEWTGDGRYLVEAAQSHHDFETCVAYDVAEGPPPRGSPVLEDFDADGRPDVWSIEVSGSTVSASVWTHASDFRDHHAVATGIPSAGAGAILPADWDRNGVVDLFVVRPGATTTVEIWSGPTFSAPIASYGMPVATSADWRFALGDRDLDGVLDLYALGPGTGATVHVAAGGAGFASVTAHPVTVPTSAAFTVDDLDGDGRDDLLFLERSGTLTILHGGTRTDALATWSWYSGRWDRHWITGDGCERGLDRGHYDMSEDGRFVAYVSNIDGAGDGNRAGDVVVEDTITGATEIVSRASDGTPAGGERCGRWCSREPALSADGRYVAFTSDADNLVPGDTNRASDVFVHDRRTGTTQVLSIPAGGSTCDSAEPCRAASMHPSISDDGRLVAFESLAANLVAGDTNGSRFAFMGTDVFVGDRATGAVRRVSLDPSGGQLRGPSRDPVISGNGRWVLFSTSAPELSAAAWHLADLAGGTVAPVPDVLRDPSISDDGRYVAFSTRYDPTPGSRPGFDVYVRDVVTGRTTILSGQATACVQPGCDAWAPQIADQAGRVAFTANHEGRTVVALADVIAGWTVVVGERTDPRTGPIVTGAGDRVAYVPAGAGAASASGLVFTAAPERVAMAGLVDTTQGLWHLWTLDGYERIFYYGNPGDVPFLGDWDCDGVETPGLYRRSDGFAYLRNSNTQGIADTKFYFGNPGDLPLAGDFDGDGCDTVSIYRPSQHRFYVINSLGSNETGLGAADFWFIFGNPGDAPFVGDHDGDGIDEIGLYRESTGRVFLRDTLTSGNADREFIYGNPGDRFVMADWAQQGIETVGVFRPATSMLYLKHSSNAGVAEHTLVLRPGGWQVVGGTIVVR